MKKSIVRNLSQPLLIMLFLTTSLIFKSNVSAEEKVIAKGKKVQLEYTLKVEGKEVETNIGKAPLEFSLGDGTIIPGLANQVEGLKIGQEKDIKISSADAYGPVNPQAFIEVPKSNFPKDFKGSVGLVVEMQDQQGGVLPAVVSEIKETSYVLNFNHPLAGKNLEFHIKVLAID